MKLLKYVFFLLLAVQIAFAGKLHVVGTYGYINDIVQRIGKDRVETIALARGDYNPHIIIPKPSYIAKVRNADLLIINGGQLEIGWLPQIIKQANNGAVQPGERGFLDLSQSIHLIDVPTSVSRELGDVHPEGNPHFFTDPENIPLIANAITARLSELDPSNKSFYEANNKELYGYWQQKMNEWNEKLKPLKGEKIVEYHKIFDYFLHRFGFTIVGTIEPLPGIPPTTKHIADVEQLIQREGVKFILQDVYNPQDASVYLSKKLNVKMIVLPHDVGAVKEADNVFSVFDEIVRRLTNG
ncbi:MAG TPA: zinc ABC transporter substrate-binding protein [Bacteroidota bacterium]|nr:zinc ABC transporter substrate-binding protein [Bacteroidota bacterium]